MVQNVFNKRCMKFVAAVILTVACIIYLKLQHDTTELNEQFINLKKSESTQVRFQHTVAAMYINKSSSDITSGIETIGGNRNQQQASAPKNISPSDREKTTYQSSVYDPLLASQRRREDIRRLCSTPQYNETGRKARGGKSLVSSDRVSLTYCPVPKSGWSTWKYLLFRQAGREDLANDETHRGYRSLWSKIGLNVLSNAHLPHTKHRMVFVRNPYERLVSAYKDKVLIEGGRYVRSHNPCNRSMLRRGPDPALTFEQFVSCIVERAKTNLTQLSDFGSGGSSDVHWRPQTLLCNFCGSDFNIIGHAGYMTEDAEMALQQLGMKNMSIVQENKSSGEKVKHTSMAEWYGSLGDKLLKEFHQLYYNDFEMLGYDMALESDAQ